MEFYIHTGNWCCCDNEWLFLEWELPFSFFIPSVKKRILTDWKWRSGLSPRSSPRCPDVAIVVIGSVLAGGQEPLLAIFLQRSQMFLKKMFVTYIAPTYFGPLPIIILAGTGNQWKVTLAFCLSLFQSFNIEEAWTEGERQSPHVSSSVAHLELNVLLRWVNWWWESPGEYPCQKF